MLFLPFLPQANESLREAFAKKAREENAVAVAVPRNADQLQHKTNIGIGHHGIGDSDYPLAMSIVEKLQQTHRGLVTKSFARWKVLTNKICEPQGQIPKQKQRADKCTLEFCWTSVRKGLNQFALNLANGLLLNIIRGERVRNRKKESTIITGSKRHPLLIVRTSKALRGWLLVNLRFNACVCTVGRLIYHEVLDDLNPSQQSCVSRMLLAG